MTVGCCGTGYSVRATKLRAASPDGRYVSGRVSEKNTDKPIDAHVSVMATSFNAQCDENGQYLLSIKASGTYQLLVGRIAYLPIQHKFLIQEGDSLILDFQMVDGFVIVE